MTAKSWMFALLKEVLVDVVDPQAPCKIYIANEQVKGNFTECTLSLIKIKLKIHANF